MESLKRKKVGARGICVVGGDQNVTHQEERLNDDLPDINNEKSGPALHGGQIPGMEDRNRRNGTVVDTDLIFGKQWEVNKSCEHKT